MKLTKQQLSQLIKEELLRVQVGSAYEHEREADWVKDKYLKPANRICRTVARSINSADNAGGRSLFLSIVNAIIDNPDDYAETIERMYPKPPTGALWLIQQIDDLAPTGWRHLVRMLSSRQKRNIKRNLPGYIAC